MATINAAIAQPQSARDWPSGIWAWATARQHAWPSQHRVPSLQYSPFGGWGGKLTIPYSDSCRAAVCVTGRPDVIQKVQLCSVCVCVCVATQVLRLSAAMSNAARNAAKISTQLAHSIRRFKHAAVAPGALLRPLGRVGALARRKGRMRHDEPPRLADDRHQRRLVDTVARPVRRRHRLVDAPALVIGWARTKLLHLDELAHGYLSCVFFFWGEGKFDGRDCEIATHSEKKREYCMQEVSFGPTTCEISVFLI